MLRALGAGRSIAFFGNLPVHLYLGIADRYRARTVLDIGAAQATLALLLAESGRSVTAVDIRPQFLEYAKTRYQRGDIRFASTTGAARGVLHLARDEVELTP